MDSAYQYPKDRQLIDAIEASTQSSIREEHSPRKRNESPRKRNEAANTKKRRGSASIDEAPFKLLEVSSKKDIQDTIQLDQLI